MIFRRALLGLMLNTMLSVVGGFIGLSVYSGRAAEWRTENKYAIDGREMLARKQIEMHKLPFPTNVTTPSDLLAGLELSLPGAGSVGAVYETPKLVRCMYNTVKRDPFVNLGDVAESCAREWKVWVKACENAPAYMSESRPDKACWMELHIMLQRTSELVTVGVSNKR